MGTHYQIILKVILPQARHRQVLPLFAIDLVGNTNHVTKGTAIVYPPSRFVEKTTALGRGGEPIRLASRLRVLSL
jgi:hypothetical protein